MQQTIALAILLCALSVQAQHGIITAKEPKPNLGQLKTQLSTYHDCKESTCYVPQIERQSNKAIEILKRRVAKTAPGEKLALVLDIDETALSNWTVEKRDDYGYIASDWNNWITQRSAPAIDGPSGSITRLKIPRSQFSSSPGGRRDSARTRRPI